VNQTKKEKGPLLEKTKYRLNAVGEAGHKNERDKLNVHKQKKKKNIALKFIIFIQPKHYVIMGDLTKRAESYQKGEAGRLIFLT
jgi:hypothetical protein